MKKFIRKDINEAIERKDFGNMLTSFTAFASDHLGIKSFPAIHIQDNDGETPSFGGYNPAEKHIVVSVKNRHPMDVFRTVAHELVHHKQNMDGRIGDVAREGSTGSDIENEANATAGIIMRNWAKNNPGYFGHSYIEESFQQVRRRIAEGQEAVTMSKKRKPKRKMIRIAENSPPLEIGTDRIRQTYAGMTPGQESLVTGIPMASVIEPKKPVEEDIIPGEGMGDTIPSAIASIIGGKPFSYVRESIDGVLLDKGSLTGTKPIEEETPRPKIILRRKTSNK